MKTIITDEQAADMLENATPAEPEDENGKLSPDQLDEVAGGQGVSIACVDFPAARVLEGEGEIVRHNRVPNNPLIGL